MSVAQHRDETAEAAIQACLHPVSNLNALPLAETRTLTGAWNGSFADCAALRTASILRQRLCWAARRPALDQINLDVEQQCR